jgi:hypothetical protein
LIPIIIGLVVLLIAKVKQNKSLRIKGYTILKEWEISILLFVQFQLIFSIILGFKYGMNQVAGVIIGIIILIGIIALGVIFLCRPKNFGEYK